MESESDWPQQVSVAGTKRRSRVQSACQRCRKQKLKCDQERPCSLCQRAEVDCISESRQRRKKIPRLNPPDRENHDSSKQSTFGQAVSFHANDTSPRSRLSHGDDQDTNSTPSRQTSTPKTRKIKPVSFDRVSTTDREAFNQRISSAGLTQEIIDSFSPETILEGSTSALPGGIGRSQGNLDSADDLITVEQLLGFELPSKRVTDYFLNTYIDAVHWFLMLFHEQTFRSNYENLMSSRKFPRCRSGQVMFTILVLSMGAHYASDEEVMRKFPTFQLKTFRSLSLKKIEDNLHSLYEAAEPESVQVCLLLASYYVYHGRPNLSFVILGAGMRCSELLLLHRESSWRGLSDIAREERRRIFWALFVFDRFAATVFGRPCGISLQGVDVKFPQNIGDTAVQHPSFRSKATMPDGAIEPVTAFSYFKYKIKLYQISTPIIGDLYFHRNSNVSELAFKVFRIDKELSDFRAALPPELRLEDLCRHPGETVTPNTRPFMLQALALQIAYDNVQILLHRPLLSQDLRIFKGDSSQSNINHLFSPSQNNITSGMQLSSQHVHQILLASRDKCWESAIRSSRLGQYQQCLVSARDSHAAAFLGINLFTAGMVLCIVALSRPLSSEAQMAKQAVARIISLSRFLSRRALLSAQTTKILKDLVRLIGEKEIKAMLAESEPAQESANVPVTTKSRDSALANMDLTAGIKEIYDLTEYTTTAASSVTATNETTVPQLKDEFALTELDMAAATENFDLSGFENIDFNNGLLLMQQAMFPDASILDSNSTVSPHNQYTNNDQGEHRQTAYPRDSMGQGNYDTATMSNDSNANYENGLQMGDFNVMNTVGQTWLWDSMSW